MIVGVDVGGSSVRAAGVDVDSGALRTAMLQRPLPRPATPAAVLGACIELVRELPQPVERVGVALPAVVEDGVVRTAAHIDPSWIGTDAMREWRALGGASTAVFLNDADAAGLAEMRLGAGRGLAGLVLVLTLGTGIGSAPFIDGRLVPNTELGHLRLPGDPPAEAEQWASARVRSDLGLDFAAWAARLDRVLAELERLFWPRAFILGGSVTEHFERWAPLLHARARVLPAAYRGQAGVVGAALAAADGYAGG